MIKIEHTEVVGWEHAIRGMRNPMNSWEKSDTLFFDDSKGDRRTISQKRQRSKYFFIELGDEDHALMMKLRNAGTDDRKFMRMIVVYLDITAPLYWWKEYDTYKVGTVANSCSTMHKIHAAEFHEEDFSFERLEAGYEFERLEAGYEFERLEAGYEFERLEAGYEEYEGDDGMHSAYCETQHIVSTLNRLRYLYNATKNRKYWDAMIQLLPTSYNQKRTVMLNYEVLANMYKARKNHKLDEWREFCKWIEGLPYSELITGKEAENDA